MPPRYPGDGLTKVRPRINIPNVESDGFMTVKGVQVAGEFWCKNYRWEDIMSRRSLRREKEGDRDLRPDSPEN